MGQNHTVVQGQYLSMIARLYGFADHKTIWNAPENAQLKQLRKNPQVLLPGDQVFIPDKELKEESRATEGRHKFQVTGEKLLLRLKLEGLKKEPLSGHDCTVAVDGDPKDITSPGDGTLELPIPRTASQGVLIDRGKPGPKFHPQTKTPFRIGGLDPVDKISGQIARLNNLGYNAGEIPEHALEEDEEEAIRNSQQFRSAVEEFQCDFMGNNSLGTIKGVVDGKCGPKTQAKLLEAHGV